MNHLTFFRRRTANLLFFLLLGLGLSAQEKAPSSQIDMTASPESFTLKEGKGLRQDATNTSSLMGGAVRNVSLISSFQAATAKEICGNGLDDDGDGWVDGDDPECNGEIPFQCDGSLYQTYNPNNIWQFLEVQTNPVNFALISNLTNQGLSALPGINSIGYNTQDNFIYGIEPNAPFRILRLDAVGTLTVLGNATGLPSSSYAGCFDLAGNYYISGGHGRLYRLNIFTGASTFIGNIGFAAADIAFNPVDGQIYGWATSPRRLMRVNPTNGSVTFVGPSQSRWSGFGALYFNAQGDIIAYGNDAQNTSGVQESLVKIDPSTGLVTLLGTSASVGGNDGCSCSANIEMTKEASTDTIVPGQTFSYVFTFFNQSGLDVTTSQFHDTLPAGLTFASEPYAATGGIVVGTTSITGSPQADFSITNLPDGTSSFTIDVIAQSSCQGDIILPNQAALDNLPAFLGGSLLSDDPTTSAILDPTEVLLRCCPANLNLSGLTNDESCPGSNDGSIDLSVGGGNGPYAFSWSNGATSEDLSGLAPGSYSVSVTDTQGCIDQASFSIGSGTDLNPPTLTCPADLTLECDQPVGPAATGSATATDDCDPAPAISFSDQTAAGNCAQALLITRTWTATDASGNSSTCVQTLTVEDNTAPTLSGVPADITVDCDNIPAAANPGAQDNCDAAPQLSLTTQTIPGNCAGNYTLIRTWTATDACGNTSSASQNITVVDSVAPSISGVPADLTVSCDNVPTAANPGVQDNCDAAPQLSLTTQTIPGNCAGNYTLIRTWTATDACGNTSSASQNITVVDSVAPSISGVPADLTVSCDNVPAAANPGVQDNCDAAAQLSLTTQTIPGNCAGNYTLIRTWTATDACGNTSSASQNITVVDSVAPALTCSGNVNVQNDPGQCGANVSFNVTATDNCGSVTTSSSQASGSFFPVGTTTVTFTASDDCGNTASCSFDVTVTDNEAPQISCGNALNFLCVADVPVIDVNSVQTNDNCGVANVVGADADNGASGCAGDPLLITRTYTATDVNGNTASCTQSITVESTPVLVTTSASPDQYVFPEFPDSSCADLSSMATGGCPPYTISWSTGQTSTDISVCPTVSTTYTVTYTDSEGCTGTGSIRVCVITGLTCVGGTNNGVGGTGQGGQGQNNSPNAQVHIAMCHVPPGNPGNAMTKCLPIPAVQAHMQQQHGGDHLGACGSVAARNCNSGSSKLAAPAATDGNTLDSRFEAFPNPSQGETQLRFTLPDPEEVTVSIYGIDGKLLKTVFAGSTEAGRTYTLNFKPTEISSGIFFARLVTGSGKVMTRKLIFIE